ncbi:hypothetical protein RI367_000542 [Sorochytrium milnesiophthora]
MAESKNDFIAGALSGSLGVLVGNPLDVVKVRLQTAASSRSTSSAPPPSILGSVSQMIRSEGVSSLFRGAASPLVSVAALNSVLFVSYGKSLSVIQSLSASTRREPTTWQAGLAGLVSGFACYAISTPTELVKCRVQIAMSSAPAAYAPAMALSATPAALTVGGPLIPAHNSLAVALQVLRKEGLRGFYRGGLVTFLRDGPGYAVYFATYEQAKRMLRSALDAERAVQLVAGGIAGVASWASIYPLDVIKSRVQTTATATAAPGRHQLLQVARDMARQEGYRVFVRGMKPTLVRAFYVNAVVFVSYEYCMERLASRTP